MTSTFPYYTGPMRDCYILYLNRATCVVTKSPLSIHSVVTVWLTHIRKMDAKHQTLTLTPRALLRVRVLKPLVSLGKSLKCDSAYLNSGNALGSNLSSFRI